jgi:hypothetical protein
MSYFDPEKLRLKYLPSSSTMIDSVPDHKVERQPKKQFLKGPIPLPWLEKAAQLPGRALAVGIVIWYRAGLHSSNTIVLTSAILNRFGVSRHAKRRALTALEEASLIAVTRRGNKNPEVTILEAPL